MRSLRHQLTGFVVASGGSLALLTAAKRFPEEEALHGWLRDGAMGFFVISCTGIGVWMLVTGSAELRRSAVSKSGPALPSHLRPSRPRALVSLFFGAILGLCVPALMLFGSP